jgi:death-on-curing protein
MRITICLTPEQVLFLHSRMIAETGGLHGVRDLGMLLSALGRPRATFGDDELYPDLFSKTAALMDSLVRNHPFMDGNKRTAIVSSGIFLRLNGFQLKVKNEEMVRFTLACAQAQLSMEDITNWFKMFSIKVSE